MQPADLFQIIHRAAAKPFDAERLFIERFGEMRMQPRAGFLRKDGGLFHQIRRHGKRRAGSERDPNHRAGRGIVIFFDQSLRIAQNLVGGLHDRIRRQAAILPAQIHAAPARVKPHAKLGGGLNLNVNQFPADALRKNVMMIRRRRAAGQHQFRHADERAEPNRLFIQPRPNRVQAGQPCEQPGIHDRRIGSGQRLIQMMMRVDQSRQNDLAVGAHDCIMLISKSL